MDTIAVAESNPHATAIAGWLLDIIDRGLDAVGLHRYSALEEIIYLVIVIVAAFAIAWIMKRLILLVLRKIVQMRDGAVGRELLKMKTLSRCCEIIPPLLFLAMAPCAFESSRKTLVVIERVAGFYAFVALGIGLGAVMDFIFYHYNLHENTRKLPIKGVLNIAKGAMWIIIGICAIALVFDKSPAMLLTGLGAFAAALMLVFKDSILGFVAGIQMSQNDMLHQGDWIVVPSTIANGIVVDVTLTVVKVRNWDNTIVTLPPYTLVSTSFQNWRGMSQSGARQICRSVNFEAYTVKRCDDDLLQRVSAKYPKMKAFIDRAKSAGKIDYDPGTAVVNGTIETNLGLFRAYMCQYLLDHPLIVTDQQILVRLLAPTTTGIPLQIWCFTTTAWTAYEAVQSEIFEHIAAVCGDFDLRLFNYASGMDTETVEMLPADSRS